jgi:heat shock protein HtpX
VAVLHEAVIRRNRRRIIGVAVLGVINYWIAAIVLTICLVLGTLVALLFEVADVGIFRAVDDVGRSVRDHPAGWALTALAVLGGFVVVGTLVGIVLIAFRLRLVEHRLLRETSARAELHEGDEREVANLLEGLAISADVPVPRFVVVDDSAPNAFVVGRKPERTVVGVTTGLVTALTRDELEAVLAHAVSRIASRDVALSTWTVAVTGRTIELQENSDRLSVTLGLLLPRILAERLRRRALKGQARQQDMVAVRFTRNPRALLDALEKLYRDGTVVRATTRATAPLWFEYPAADGQDVSERIATLRELLRDPPPELQPSTRG